MELSIVVANKGDVKSRGSKASVFGRSGDGQVLLCTRKEWKTNEKF